MRRSRAFLWLVTVAGLLLGALTFLDWQYDADGPLGNATLVSIPAGVGLSETALILAEAGAVVSPRRFAFGAWIRGAARELRAGEYEIPAEASMAEVLAMLRTGAVFHRRFVVPEGVRAATVRAALLAEPLLIGEVAMPMEGSVAPDTYFFARGEGRQALLDRMLAEQNRRLREAWESRDPDLPLASPAEALILASIVERETALAAERDRVAAVFVNRLRRGMRLQSDPTVIYGIVGSEGVLGRVLTRADLKVDSPYNTYRHRGLPPGPIANPGLASIRAALNPAESEDLYFVADGSGGHAFARTLAEHNRNVARWRALQREDSE